VHPDQAPESVTLPRNPVAAGFEMNQPAGAPASSRIHGIGAPSSYKYNFFLSFRGDPDREYAEKLERILVEIGNGHPFVFLDRVSGHRGSRRIVPLLHRALARNFM